MQSESQLCTFYLEDQMFGIDVQTVQEVIRYQQMTDIPLAPDAVCGLINLRGQIVTAIDLRKRLGLPCRPEGQLPMNVVVRSEDGAVSLLVDQIGDVQESDQEKFEPSPETLRGATRHLIRGAYKMRDRLLLILDTDRVIDVTNSLD
jgi:purine-binding chemotaxis protein CheW